MVSDTKEVWLIKAGLDFYTPAARWFMFCLWEETEDNWQTYKTLSAYRPLPRDWQNKGDSLWWVQHWTGCSLREEFRPSEEIGRVPNKEHYIWIYPRSSTTT